MRIFGINIGKDLEMNATEYRKSVFPFGGNQEDKISEILLKIFDNVPIDELKYNYIITKQAIINKNIESIPLNELKGIAKELDSKYISKIKNVYYYMALAQIDINIDSELNYPDVEIIRENGDKLKDMLLKA